MVQRALTVLLISAAFPAFAADDDRKDHHSFANPHEVSVRHVDLDLTVDFERKQLRGHAILTVEMARPDKAATLLLDTRDLQVSKASITSDRKGDWSKAKFNLGKTDPILGTPLEVPLPPATKFVRIEYSTGLRASGLQWLDREQTSTKKQPFLYTQSQAIHARSWIPVQDSPGVRVTFTARIRTPKGLRAVMSASNDPKTPTDGDYKFEMSQAIPPYLIALAVGELEFKPIGPRTGIWAEIGVAAKAADEFADLEKMVKATEDLYGPYRWGRYDVLVLPPSFPYGGMENPRLTFASPTVLAGDKSLVSLVAHELSHSWSGNLVSNATWRDFWLNEGFTVYLERRIIEKVYGKEREAMEAVLGRRGLGREMANMKPADQVLHIDLTGRDPDEGLTDIPYEKGALFLRHIEQTVGRERFDAFLKSYFDHFAFKSITTADFVKYLNEHLIKGDTELAGKLNVEEWIYKPGIPGRAPQLTADAFTRVEMRAKAFTAGAAAGELGASDWSTQEWLHFLTSLPNDIGAKRLSELDARFKLTQRGNAEIAFQWLLMAIRNRYEPAFDRLEQFLTSHGRRKFLKPLYEELVKTPAGKERALKIYTKARPTYHPIAVSTIDGVVGWKE